jgi:ribosomal protein S6--L-glutamate ligase
LAAGVDTIAPTQSYGRMRLTKRRPGVGLHVAVLAEARYLKQRQPSALVAALVRAGHCVEQVVPEALALQVTGATPLAADGVVARGRSDVLLAALRVLEMTGTLTINRAAAIAGVRDKAGMSTMLQAAGIPTPPTWLGAPGVLVSSVPEACFPLIIKPLFGDNAEGIQLAVDPTALERLVCGVMLAQPYLMSDGYDLKLYVIGTDVWAIRKPSPFQPTGRCLPSGGRRVAVTAELEALALRCGQLFDLEIYGVDCLETPQGLVVIEVNDFPNYTDVSDAPARAADHVAHRLWGAA